MFLVCHAIELDVEQAELRIDELDVFIGDRWLVTVHRGRRRADRAVRRPVGAGAPARRDHGVGFAVYALLDVVVDGYFDTIDRFERFYDDVADQVFGESPDRAERSTASGSRCARR